MELSHVTLTPEFGSELAAGIKLLDLADEDLDPFKLLCAERGVVVARDQVMTPEEQARFAGRLGELFKNPGSKDGTPEELIKIKANEKSKFAAGTGWHSDVSSEQEPPGLSILRMEVVPESGGDTLFANMTHIFESLSPSMQSFLKTLKARHDPRGHYLYLRGVKTKEELGTSLHPVVRVHPLTGKPALYVNSGFTDRIVDLSDRESVALLRFLYDTIAYAVDAQIRISWRPHTVVVWDNRVVQHHASFDYFPATRMGYRATVRGEPVIAAS